MVTFLIAINKLKQDYDHIQSEHIVQGRARYLQYDIEKWGTR